jgi:hypothetical protein
MNRAVWIAAGIALFVIFILGGILGAFFGRMLPLGSMPRIGNTTTIVKQIQSLNELATVRYTLEKVVILEDVKWYGGNRVVLVASGVVKAGVDLGRLKEGDVAVSGDLLTIKIPKAEVLDAYLKDRETQVLDRSTGLFREFDKDLEQEARKQAVGQMLIAAKRHGILADADERATLQLQAFFSKLGFKEVRIEPGR